jgi:hypothetical protein
MLEKSFEDTTLHICADLKTLIKLGLYCLLYLLSIYMLINKKIKTEVLYYSLQITYTFDINLLNYQRPKTLYTTPNILHLTLHVKHFHI